MIDLLPLVGRENPIFTADIKEHDANLRSIVSESSFLVIGGGGSIGRAVVKELFAKSPRRLDVVDISENNLVELVRDVRSDIGYTTGDFRTYPIDAMSDVFDSLLRSAGPYDYILNFAALKHVRSEKDPFTIMRMIEVNIELTLKTVLMASERCARKYFCVSSDKAAAPVNMMGATKRIMELFLKQHSREVPVSTARFANVAFSDGSLPFGFRQRLFKRQPISAPFDVKRYFVTESESGQLCMLSSLLGENRDVFFPKLNQELHMTTFSEIACRFLAASGYEAVVCDSEEEARGRVDELAKKGQWPCFFFKSDTTGEKDFEEFFTADEMIDWSRFQDIGVIKSAAPEDATASADSLEEFLHDMRRFRKSGSWSKGDILASFLKVLPEFAHLETGKYLDNKM